MTADDEKIIIANQAEDADERSDAVSQNSDNTNPNTDSTNGKDPTASSPIKTENAAALPSDKSITEHVTETVAESESEPESKDSESGSGAENELHMEILALRNRFDELDKMLARQKDFFSRLDREIDEFCGLFGDVCIGSLPDEVWEDVKRGNSLAAAYALYAKRREIVAERAKIINENNAKLSACSLGGATGADEIFSPSEVRAMDAAEVRANYDKIIKSAGYWRKK